MLAEVDRQMLEVPTRAVAADAWENDGEIIVVDSHEEAARESDRWAPEHLEVQTAKLALVPRAAAQLRQPVP